MCQKGTTPEIPPGPEEVSMSIYTTAGKGSSKYVWIHCSKYSFLRRSPHNKIREVAIMGWPTTPPTPVCLELRCFPGCRTLPVRTIFPTIGVGPTAWCAVSAAHLTREQDPSLANVHLERLAEESARNLTVEPHGEVSTPVIEVSRINLACLSNF